ncbi:MAG: 30S ribosomal protein S21 [Candidatus Marinimicrobia bacterium CG08_land_8_20_14_0_20_45_22]|nr:MAG: 30S ribosomal protein S21 [Candidatus Marinimicrobia bacterium CG08_land_8_20_14_0_20_45_22]
MIEVIVGSREPFERALRRFKKKYEKAGILKDLKKNEFYVKPSAERRMRRSKAAKRQIRTIYYQEIPQV